MSFALKFEQATRDLLLRLKLAVHNELRKHLPISATIERDEFGTTEISLFDHCTVFFNGERAFNDAMVEVRDEHPRGQPIYGGGYIFPAGLLGYSHEADRMRIRIEATGKIEKGLKVLDRVWHRSLHTEIVIARCGRVLATKGMLTGQNHGGSLMGRYVKVEIAVQPVKWVTP